ncbi:MAG TPA: hypothetical protein VG054_07605 [Acidimicrobiales bacterium]|jgi:hypothetical protein|nr:hypothetical protein [Acidimicrobiales bacterium]
MSTLPAGEPPPPVVLVVVGAAGVVGVVVAPVPEGVPVVLVTDGDASGSADAGRVRPAMTTPVATSATATRTPARLELLLSLLLDVTGRTVFIATLSWELGELVMTSLRWCRGVIRALVIADALV